MDKKGNKRQKIENNKYKTNEKSSETKASNTILTIEKLGNDFEGVCYIKGNRCLVKGALPKEKVEVTDPKKSGNVTIYKLVKVLSPSEYRSKENCPYAKECGACTLLHINTVSQRKFKTETVKRRLNEWRNLVEDIVFVENPCRNKIQLCFKGSGENMQIGFFNSETHKVVDIPSCLMHDENFFSALRSDLKKWCAKFCITAYNPHRQRGNLRFCVARILGKSILVTLVFYKENEIDGLPYLYSRLKEHFEKVSLNINVNNQISNAVFDKEPQYYMGEKELAYNMSGVKFLYRAGDFLQTNTDICEKIYRDALSEIKSFGAETVIDAYSGIGITSTLFAKNELKVKSIEISEKAVQTAKNTAKLNGTDNAIEFYSGDFANIIDRITTENFTSLFVDPPRAGLGGKVCKAILKKDIAQIIYMSCELDTLISDIEILKHKYKIIKIKPYDMFANTKHIEVLCVLQKIRD